MKKIVVPNEALVREIVSLVEEGREVNFTPKGMSMLPFIRGDRDSVLLGRPLDLRVGDIVLARHSGGSCVLHRIAGMDGDKVVLMGDGNIAGREYCSRSDVMAKAVGILRNGKRVDCTSSSHRFLSWIWKIMLPVRRYLLAIYRRIIL